MQKKAIKLDLSLSDTQVDELLAARIGTATIKPELVLPEQIRSPESYNRFREQEVKDQYRTKLLESLSVALGKDSKLLQELLISLDTNGAVTFGNVIDTDRFAALIQKYTEKLKTNGSQSWIHSYINFANHPDFLTDQNYCAAFFHPLLVLMMSYAVGGPIRIVDVRGKDAEPLAVQAQDNMLHIDNTPFRKEFKVIVTWKKGEVSGPSGQNFVFIPGTHKGVRNCQVSPEGKAWSTEDGSIFITPESVATVFELQNEILHTPPTVVEVTHKTKPLTTVFEAGALVHHRYRTKEKNTPRSCIIAAFHRAQDNPGQFLSKKHLDQFAPQGSLLHLMMGSHQDNTEESFIAALVNETPAILEKLQDISERNSTELVAYSEKVLDHSEFEQWKKTVTSSPTVADIKKTSAYFKLGAELNAELLTKMMSFDKHGPIDLILYGDGHEEIRKWARNRIREMQPAKLQARIQEFEKQGLLPDPSVDSFLSLGKLEVIAEHLVEVINNLAIPAIEAANLDPNEKITKYDAFRSLKQLCTDLGEAIVRCSSRHAFLSTSLFLFWACDELKNLIGSKNIDLKLHEMLLAHYVTTYILVEKQIRKEDQLIERKNATSLIVSSGSFDFSEEYKPESNSDVLAPLNNSSM